MDKARLLIVDDLDLNRMLMIEHLKKDFTDIDEAANGPEALEKIRQAFAQNRPYNIAIIDHVMPVMSGLECGREIRQNANWDKVVLIGYSSKNNDSLKQDYIDAGFKTFLTKPCPPSVLLETVHISLKEAMSKGKKQAGDYYKYPDPIPFPLYNSNKVLVVTANNQARIKSILDDLSKAGLEITIIDNSQEALTQAKNQNFDFLIIDKALPVISGPQLMKFFRYDMEAGIINTTPIICLTEEVDDKFTCSWGQDDDYCLPYEANEKQLITLLQKIQ